MGAVNTHVDRAVIKIEVYLLDQVDVKGMSENHGCNTSSTDRVSVMQVCELGWEGAATVVSEYLCFCSALHIPQEGW